MYSFCENRQELLSIILGVRDELWNIKTEASDWTLAQVVWHLGETDHMFLSILQKEVQNESAPSEKRNLSFVENRSAKLKTPKEPPNNPISKEEALSFLRQIREEFLLFLEQYPLTHLETKSANLGALGVLNLDQVVEFVALHEKRHIGQIKDIIEALNKQKG